MSEEGYHVWDEEEEEEEEDFVPGEDYGEEGDDYVDDGDDEDDHGGFPSILEGDIFIDRNKGLCYEQDGIFSLVCKSSIPANKFNLEAPVIDTPLLFAGWINDPNRWIEFEIVFSKEEMSTDPLQIQFLDAQQQKQLLIGSSTKTKSDNDSIDDDWMEKKSPAKKHLKASQSHSSKEMSANLKDSGNFFSSTDSPSNIKDRTAMATSEGKVGHQESSKKAPKSDVTESDMKVTAKNNMIIIVSGSQIGNDGTNDSKISFRGAYRCPSKASVERVYLICPIQSLDRTVSNSVAGGTAAVAAAGNKKSGDDDSVEVNAAVAYQELIDLHDDTRLSTDELRKRYYGSGDQKKEIRKSDGSENKRFKAANDFGDDDDDDDDTYGF